MPIETHLASIGNNRSRATVVEKLFVDGSRYLFIYLLKHIYTG